MRSRFVGCLLGCAIGDSLGMPVEGMSREEILSTYGEIREFFPGRGLSAGSYTDDTQLTIALAESIIQCGDFYPGNYAKRIVEWKDYAVGAGFTCMYAAIRLSQGVDWRASGLGSAGCGSAMRAYPIGLLDIFQPKKLKRDAEESSLITHTDSRAIAGTIAIAYATSLAVRESKICGKEMLQKIRDFVGHTSTEFYESLSNAMKYDGMNIQKALSRIGTSGYVVETVNASLFIASQSSSFQEGIIEAVNAGGDTDSIGAITGGILGAKYGYENIPSKWSAHVQDRNRISNLADLLFKLVSQRNY
jgi:ADP-ribosylglycohydrolase